MILATPAETHYALAKIALARNIPVLIEKPVALKSSEADELVAMGGIAFAGHTRLFSPAWRAFKARHPNARKVEGFAGPGWWDWGPHLVAMSIDLGCEKPILHLGHDRLRIVADGEEFIDTHDGPLSVLVSEFLKAIKKGEPDNAGLRLGARVVRYLENECPLRT